MRLIERLAAIPTGRRSKLAVLLAAVLLCAALASQAGKLEQVTTADPGASLPDGAESLDALRAAERIVEPTAPAIAVVRRAAGLGEDDLRRAEELAADLDADPVALQISVGEPEVSGDGSTLALAVVLEASEDSDATVAAVEELRERLAAAFEPGGGLEAAVTGAAAYSADISSVFEGADTTLLIVAGGLVLFLLVVIYRSPIFWIVPFAVVVLTELAARGAGYLLGSAGLTITGQSQGILIVLVFGAATDYALLLVARYREELRRRDDTHAAMRAALRQVAPAILASSGTVIAGLATLLVADVGGTQAVGPLGAAGVALAMVTALTALPAALLVVGRRAFWPFVPTPDDDDPERGPWGAIARAIPRAARRIWISAALLLALLAVGLTGLDTGLTQRDQFTDEVDAVRGQELLEGAFPGGVSAPLSVVVPDPGRADDVGAALEAAEPVAAVGEAGEGPPGALLEAVLRGDPFSPAAIDAIPGLRSAVSEVEPGVLVGGRTAQEHDLRESARRDNIVVPPLALAVVLAILVLLLRSLLAPALLLLTVVASNAAAIGLGVVISDRLFGFPGLDPTVPLLAFVFLVALGIDYNIFLATRAREEAEREGARRGMLRALAVTGGVITAAGIVLAGTFATLAVLPLAVLTQLGTIVAVGVLLDAVVVRSLLVPALAHDLGPRFWWPARLGPDGPARDDAAEG